ncbi:MAG: glyoxalase/bleomycin resistance/dioxygenase family protein [Alphaproteobacteria bacterium]|nr:glyoxalase/bleomycin resistance/dioxygenase family protein [Alphaproteobacteria bacterium]
MKRLHVHVAVPDLEQSIRFYSTLFGAEPVKVKHDYAKWMLEDPRVNFAISQRGARSPGVDHVGVQVDTRAELDELAGRLKAAGSQTLDEEATTCCYAKSDKTWVNDPAGVRWETFYTFGDATAYGEDAAPEPKASAGACCGAAAAAAKEKPAEAVGGCCS